MILHKGEVLFRQGELGALFRIKKGLFKVVRIHEDGSQFLFNLLYDGEFIPHHSLISPKEYHGTAIALVTSEVERIPKDEWYASLAKNPERYRNIALIMQDKLRVMQQRIDHLTAITPKERFELFEQWFKRYVPGYKLTDVLTQEEIGQFIGMRRETINRVLRSLY